MLTIQTEDPVHSHKVIKGIKKRNFQDLRTLFMIITQNLLICNLIKENDDKAHSQSERHLPLRRCRSDVMLRIVMYCADGAK